MKPWADIFASSAFRRSADIAHDLKTPLNIAVLNLELLRMRMAKVTQGAPDEKLESYARSIELELRRIAQIVDAFFLFSVPPRSEGDPLDVKVGALIAEAAERGGIPVSNIITLKAALAHCHPVRIREMFRMFFDGISRLSMGSAKGDASIADGHLLVEVEGPAPAEEFDPSKVLKFYYTDASGNPDLSLASARLIAETYGGAVEAENREGKIRLTLSLPLGEE